jgi:hypothetical protein
MEPPSAHVRHGSGNCPLSAVAASPNVSPGALAPQVQIQFGKIRHSLFHSGPTAGEILPGPLSSYMEQVIPVVNEKKYTQDG